MRRSSTATATSVVTKAIAREHRVAGGEAVGEAADTNDLLGGNPKGGYPYGQRQMRVHP